MDSNTTTLSMRLDDPTMARLERLAHATERTKTWLLKKALDDFLDNNEWQVEQIEEGLREADRGDLIAHDAVLDKWERKLADSMDAASRS